MGLSRFGNDERLMDIPFVLMYIVRFKFKMCVHIGVI